MLDDETLLEAIARDMEARVRDQIPIDTGWTRRKRVTGDSGMPVWLYELLHEVGYDGYIHMIEIGGRGVLTDDGWVSVEELCEIAGKIGDDDDA